jgi:two-component system chemotaxis response regulator CheB
MCPFEVKEAETGDHVLPGRVLIAPGEKHLTFQNNAGIFTVQCKNGDKVKGHCPSVEVLFHSVAVNAGKNAIGIILTGMGSDGAEGMLEMRKNGARTLAQDEKSSVVFGMPLEAYKNGGAERLVSLEQIPAVLTELVKEFREPVKH